MKKGSKQRIATLLLYCILAAFFVLTYIGIRIRCEELTKTKVVDQQELGDKNNWNLNLVAQRQSLSSEERIVKIAEDQLGLVKDNGKYRTIPVDSEDIARVEQMLKEKYE